MLCILATFGLLMPLLFGPQLRAQSRLVYNDQSGFRYLIEPADETNDDLKPVQALYPNLILYNPFKEKVVNPGTYKKLFDGSLLMKVRRYDLLNFAIVRLKTWSYGGIEETAYLKFSSKEAASLFAGGLEKGLFADAEFAIPTDGKKRRVISIRKVRIFSGEAEYLMEPDGTISAVSKRLWAPQNCARAFDGLSRRFFSKQR